MTDKEMQELSTRMLAGALLMTQPHATAGTIAIACLAFLATDGHALNEATAAVVGLTVDRAIAYRAAQRARAGAAQA